MSGNASDRGQTFTLEAFIAAILLISTVAFALQAVAVTSNTASASETELRGQHVGLAEGVLDRSVENGDLRRTLLYWNESENRFHGAGGAEGFYVSTTPNTTFGDSLDAMFDGSGIRYNVDLHYLDEDGERRRQRLIEFGAPGEDAVRVVETVTLYDHTELVDADGARREDATLGSIEGEFYASDAGTDGPLYNVIRVEVVLWRT